MILKNFISAAKSTNAKLEGKFNALSKISLNLLIFGQLFLVLILSAEMLYAVSVSLYDRVMLDIFKSIQTVFENAASGVCLLWLVAIFLDYIDKNRNASE